MTYKIFIDSIDILDVRQKLAINTLNPYSYIVAKKDPIFQDALHQSDILISDDSGIVLAAKLIKKRNILKVAGSDLHVYLLNELTARKGKCFYMGSAESTLKKIKERMGKEYPDIIVETYSPLIKQLLRKKIIRL